LEHLGNPVRRELMREIDWSHRLIGIKGSRGVGKTTFLLQYARDYFTPNDRSCLYINLNNLYFPDHSLEEFASSFYRQGGRTLLIDQVFKYPEWSEALRHCYDTLPELQIIFTGSTVMRLKEENPLLDGLVASYNLRGFSFREYLNIKTGLSFHPYTLDEILNNHEAIARAIAGRIQPLEYFDGYLHHGYYPFFLDKSNFSENLIKTINLMMEIDILLLKQLELSYLPKLRRLLYLVFKQAPGTFNVSRLSQETQISRSTVMNYIKCFKDARLINMLYREGECYPQKPAMLYLHNPNLIYSNRSMTADRQAVCETFFYNTVHSCHRLNLGKNSARFVVDNTHSFRIISQRSKVRMGGDMYYVIDNIEVGNNKSIPLWLFGFLY
jgi:predicted AAA+ superfamily ATPase